MKIKPEQVPSEVVKAMLREWDRGTSVQPAALIAAAINAWPKRGFRYERHGSYPVVVLPYEEPGDAE